MEKKVRYVVLDALRGFALLGIILANFPEFSLWTFSDPAGWTRTDLVTRAFLTFFVDGKFYTLFSLLFGIGFSIQLERADGHLKTFYRRMAILFFIGLGHLLFLWSGDILMLYALCGMVLPLFRKLPVRKLLGAALVFYLLPVLSEAVFGSRFADPLEARMWSICGGYGITQANYSTWLADAHSYREVLQFLHQGAVERMWEFVSSRRYFKVMGLFLTGLAVGKAHLYVDIRAHAPLLRKVVLWGFAVGAPMGVFYTWSVMAFQPWGPVVHSALYLLAEYPMGFAYAALFCLLYDRRSDAPVWKPLSRTGRMACTNYLSQSVFGILIFYGIGLGLGARVGLLTTEVIALGVYLFQCWFSAFWLKWFRYGPVEWVWRMLTYGKRLPMRVAHD